MCYTYDKESRVTKRVITDMCCTTLSEETYSYDAAGNVTVDSSCIYDKNNRLIEYNGKEVVYDLDGNMLSDGMSAFEYDSANRLIKAGTNEYTYNAEDVRIRNLCGEEDTTYIYNTNCRLSQLLTKTTNGVASKYVYGLGLIGEESADSFKTYHFDYRGSTVAITNLSGTITDTFEYDTYGKLIARTGTSNVLFMYNGRDGVVTDANGLIYMRARYYSPDMRRFINADIISGEISNAITLNRYAYANGNPVSNTDPFGLSVERGQYGSIVYKGVTYPIYVSGMQTTNGPSISNAWDVELIKTISLSDFDWAKFFAMAEFDDYELSNSNINGALGITGLIGSANKSISTQYFTIKLLSKDSGKRRAIIAVTDNETKELASKYAGLTVTQISGAGLVEDIMGKDVESGVYIISASIDKARSQDPTSAHIWVNNGSLMQTPFVLPGDKITATKVTSAINKKTYTANFSNKSSKINSAVQEGIISLFAEYGFTLK